MKNEPTEIIKHDSPAEMIRLAVTGGADLDKLEKLLTLQERWDANEAKKAFNAAMASFKSNPPKIDRDQKVAIPHKNDSGYTRYNHASLANVVEKITVELSKHGLSASWRTQQNGQIIVTCRITHVKGHSEETSLSAPSDTSGSKNPIQAIGSTISYLERYSLLSVLGLATYEQDDDAVASGNLELITEEQQITIREYLTATNSDEQAFLKYMRCSSLDAIPAKDFKKAITALKTKEKKVKK